MQPTLETLDGGCLCGNLRYRISHVGEIYDECYCHCRTCQRSTGAPVVAWVGIKRPNFVWTAGTPTRYTSSFNGTRSFCPKCGTHILFEFTNSPEELDVTVASLDQPNRTPPKVHLWLSSSPQWFKIHDDLPQFQEARIRQKN